MTDDAPTYDLAAIRRLLLAAFTPRTLRRFCQDRPLLRPIVASFGPGHGLDDMVDRVVDYCQARLLWAELLAAVEQENPKQYARFAAAVHAAAAPVGPPPDPAAVAAYLDRVREQCGQVETRPYRQVSELREAAPSLSLLPAEGRAGVYVPLRFDLHPSRASLEGRPEPARRGAAGTEEDARQLAERDLTRTDVPLAEVLAAPGHLVLIGAAGCGKTTVLRLVAAVLASGDPELARGELGIEAGPLPVPILVALRDWEHACQTAPATYCRDVDGLLRFVDDHWQRWHPDARVPPGLLGGLVRAGRAWLLLDALDEVADFDHRIAARQVIERLAAAFPGTRLLVTARVAAYAHAESRLDERFHLATVRDLTREQWAPLVERLYAGLEAGAGPAAERARRLLARIDAAPLLQEMVKTPLMVWTATLIHYADRELPEQRAELYRAYVDVLLGERLHEEESAEAAQRLRDERWPQDDRRLYLTYAAYQVHAEAGAGQSGRRAGAPVVVDERDLVRRILGPFLAGYLSLDERQARREAQEFVGFMAERSGLLHAHPEGYSFGDHLTVQEFLAASYLVDNLRGSDDWTAFLQARAGQSWWREVVLLMAGILLQWPQQARRYLLDELGKLPATGGEADAPAYGLAWAGRALLEIPASRVGWHAAARDELARRLVGVLWQNPPAASVAARLEAGEVLGLLGDPRFTGDCLLPELVPIPGGRFWMGSDEAEVERLVRDTGQDWPKRELPRHEVELGAFALARYPTTNAMFRRFVDGGGYADGRWWAEARAAKVWRPDGTVKDAWGDVRRQPAYWDDARFNGPSQPVVGVTWYEAVAYCRWLTAHLDDGSEYRLPTEAEWERAARGGFPSPAGGGGAGGEGRAREYPWGDDWAEGRANSEELHLERTTPAGMFPDGASAEGVLDLSGNVWEWCQSLYKPYPYRENDGRENPTASGSRVLRGGCYGNDSGVVRCAYRGDINPDGRYDFLGFRVARGSTR